MRIIGTTASERLTGTSGADSISGLAGNDTVDGGGGADVIEGDDGNDNLFNTSSTESNTIHGGNGNDSIFGGKGNDFLYGDDGDDYVEGGGGNDQMFGGAGSDRLYTDGGNSTMWGGAGNDTMWVGSHAGSTVFNGEDGDDQITGGIGNDTLVGGNGNDYLNGAAGNDSLDGGAGDDELVGGAGNDTLDGGTGNNMLEGGAGNDTYVVRSRGDFIYETTGTDSGLVLVNWYKTNPDVENWTWGLGVQKLPYWIDALLPGVAPMYAGLLNGGTTMNFSFLSSAPAAYDTEDIKGFRAFTPEQQAFARQALAYISTVINLKFVESTNGNALNTISFSNNLQDTSAGYALYPSDTSNGSDVHIDYSGNDVAALTPVEGKYAALTFIHEIGHALGLKHPFTSADASGDLGEGPALSKTEDSTQWTVMSYTQRTADYYLRYSVLDIAALQYLYGPSPTARAGNDTYTLSTTATNMLWDGAGNDTVDGSALTANQPLTLYLEPGYWGYIGSKAASYITSAGQVTVNFGTVLENALGGAGNDYIAGNDANNSLTGGLGNDTIIGGGGADTVVGLQGNDLVFGGDGSDTLKLASASSAAKVLKLRDNAFFINDGSGDTAMVRDVEQVQYSDKTVLTASLPVFDSVNAALTQIYVAAFRRAPETGGYNYWNGLVTQKGLASVADTIFALDIVKAIYPDSMTASQFVTAIYKNVFNRDPDSDGLAYWTGQLASSSRGQLVLSMTSIALAVPDGTLGKDYFQNRLDWALYAVGYQDAKHAEMTPAHLTTLTDGVTADAGTLLSLIGQAETGVTI